MRTATISLGTLVWYDEAIAVPEQESGGVMASADELGKLEAIHLARHITSCAIYGFQ